jgi:predicted nucleotidyltransferase
LTAALTGGTSEKKRRGRILKIILFGSFARGGWVDDRASGYKSDYNILVVVNYNYLTDFEFWEAADDRLMHHPKIRREVQLIFEPLERVNSVLAKGQ